jgi:hypothetical protein
MAMLWDNVDDNDEGTEMAECRMTGGNMVVLCLCNGRREEHGNGNGNGRRDVDNRGEVNVKGEDDEEGEQHHGAHSKARTEVEAKEIIRAEQAAWTVIEMDPDEMMDAAGFQ